jgi:hypothetical protein
LGKLHVQLNYWGWLSANQPLPELYPPASSSSSMLHQHNNAPECVSACAENPLSGEKTLTVHYLLNDVHLYKVQGVYDFLGVANG